MRTLASPLLLVAVTSLAACGDDPRPGSSGTTVLFDVAADLSRPERFFDFPYPSDLRLTPGGGPDFTGFPDPNHVSVVEGLRGIAGGRQGFPVVPVAWFSLTDAVAPRDPAAVVPADAASPLLLVDVDLASPERGRLVPVVAATPRPDDYVPDHLLAVAPRPGFVLHGRRRYAFVVRRSLRDAAGRALVPPPAFAALAAGGAAPDGKQGGARARDLYAPLWPTLEKLGVAAADVAAATVFTTGDVVADTAALTTALVARHKVAITDLHQLDSAADARLCRLAGSVVYPQFQRGTPPFNQDGRFVPGDDGLPVKQRDEAAPVTITLPRAPMPAGGYPLLVYFHGSGGSSRDAVDKGPAMVRDGPQEPGRGPAWVLAPIGLATAASALPVNPERLPDASETAYLNLNNLAAFRDTFRQGVVEQRLFIEALRTLTIPPAALGACSGPSLPQGETAFHFAPERLVAQGQSMGGMYTNLVGAVEPRIRAVVPTGAGGYWSDFILETSLIAGVKKVVAGLLRAEDLTFLHPTMQLLETAWEAADPIVYVPRLARRPLPGHPVRPIYEPVGQGDSYFPTVLYDAMALAYGHQEAGTVVWPTMQSALALAKLDGVIAYPVSQNRTSEAGGSYTGVVVQYAGDGVEDPHQIYRQLDAVKHQYRCFLDSFLTTGVARVPAPAAADAPCP